MIVFNNFIRNSVLLIVLNVVSHVALASDLVDPKWLYDNSQQVKIIDLRHSSDYLLGHIPNAINIPLQRFTRVKNNVKGFVETPAAFKALMEEHGINNDDTLVLYSDWSFLGSMRVYWVMDFYGHNNVKVLNGGIQAWVNSGANLSTDAPPRTSSSYVIEINTDVITTKFQTFMASKNPDYVLVDARDNTQYRGEKSLTPRKGHIPGAINIPWVNLVKNRNESDNYSHSASSSTLEDIQILKEKLALIPKDKKIILYCNGGQESSVLYFALKELGVSASVYDGSWFEWSSDAQMPVVTLGTS